VERGAVREARDARRRRRNRVVALLAMLVLAAAGTWAWRARSSPGGNPIAAVLGGNDARAPEGVRIRVEVLNATRTRGLARSATRVLRDRGFDVVGVGNDPQARDSTLVLDRSGHPDWAQLVAEALGGARVEARPDTSRYLDVTVLLGTAWRAPPEALYP
jgi:hypothetical protein